MKVKIKIEQYTLTNKKTAPSFVHKEQKCSKKIEEVL
jgi:hypothetical protein